MYAQEYLSYCKAYEIQAQFLLDGGLVKPKEAEKIIKQLWENPNPARFDMFVNQINEIATKDKDFQEWFEKSGDTCGECNYYPVKRIKLSKYHPEHIKACNDFKKNLNCTDEEMLKWPKLIHLIICPACGSEDIELSGIDDNPEIGLRGDLN
jgi:hypothetical protein